MNALYFDFGAEDKRAMHYIAGSPHHRATLQDLLRCFPKTRARQALEPASLALPLADLSIISVTLGTDGVPVGLDDGARVGVLDLAPRAAVAGAPASVSGPPTGSAPVATRFPETLSDRDAVELVYFDRLKEIAAYPRSGLSVLVQCDKALVPYVHPRAVELSRRVAVLDSA